MCDFPVVNHSQGYVPGVKAIFPLKLIINNKADLSKVALP